MAGSLDPGLWMDTSAGRYFVCDDRLRIAADDPGSTKPPAGWRQAHKALEEPLETLLVLNLARVLSDDVSFLFRAGDYWALHDITGVDALGRVHIMELKKDKIDGAVAEQLAAYMAEAVFDGRADFVRRMAHLNATRLTEARWAVYLAGTLANRRTTSVGPVDYAKHISSAGRGPSLSKSQWDNQTDAERQGRQVETLLAILEDAGHTSTIGDVLAAWASEVRAATRPSLPASPPFRVRQPGVFWLIGRRVDADALDQTRRWRRMGVDVRPLCVEARQHRDTGRWMLRVLREEFPERRAVVQQVVDGIEALNPRASRETDDTPLGYELEVSLYSRVAASTRDPGAGGQPLRGDTRARLYGPDREKPVAVWSAAGRLP